MKAEACGDMRLLMQADLDGELSSAEAARVAAHLESCAPCAAAQTQLAALSSALRAGAPRYSAPDQLRQSIGARMPGVKEAAVARPAAAWRRAWGRQGAAFGGGFALAACLALALLWRAPPGGLADAVVADHIRALQPGHLMDVISTDRHTVKPWFDGRLDFAPPVKDLQEAGFPLAGGRLDYFEDHPVAALIYRSRQHVIELFIWRGAGGTGAGRRNGYNYVRWTQDGMACWAVSDLNAAELNDFVRLWRAG
jgi:anti-sigma factor RsiW